MTIETRNQTGANIRRLCEKRGLRIEPFGKNGWRIVGFGVDILTVGLHHVAPFELKPPKSR